MDSHNVKILEGPLVLLRLGTAPPHMSLALLLHVGISKSDGSRFRNLDVLNGAILKLQVNILHLRRLLAKLRRRLHDGHAPDPMRRGNLALLLSPNHVSIQHSPPGDGEHSPGSSSPSAPRHNHRHSHTPPGPAGTGHQPLCETPAHHLGQPQNDTCSLGPETSLSPSPSSDLKKFLHQLLPVPKFIRSRASFVGIWVVRDPRFGAEARFEQGIGE